MAKVKLTDKMIFGKYKGETLEEVILFDPTYIEWALDEVNDFELDDNAMNIFEQSIDDYYDNEE